MSNTIYVVMGGKGDYDDYEEWVVCYYDNQARAERHAREALKACRELEARYEAYRRELEEAGLYPDFRLVQHEPYVPYRDFGAERLDKWLASQDYPWDNSPEIYVESYWTVKVEQGVH